MKPVTREEQYLNRLTGEEQEIPEEPVTREEQYLARLCGQTNSIPEKPVTRREEYLANLCGEDVIIPEEQVTRMEQYMAFAAGARETKPGEPVTREEWYWDKYQGGDVPEEKTIAFTDIITVTDALARPAVDLQSEITATQNLNGYEYPWVGGAGKNKLNHGTIDVTPNTIVTTTLATMFLESGTYTLSYTLDTTVTATRNRPTCIIGSETIYGNDIKTAGRGSWTFTLEEDATVTLNWWYHTVSTACTISDFQLEIGSTVTAYEPYENICPISGRTEVNVTRTGVNVWDEETEFGYYYSRNGQPYPANNQLRSKNFISVKPNTSYLFNKSFNYGDVLFYDANKSIISAIINLIPNYIFTTPENCYYIHLNLGVNYGTTYNNDVSINYPSTATAYEPYEGDTFNTELGRTVYGGTLDLTTGELTITHAYVDLGDLTWTVTYLNVFQVYINEKKVGSTNFITTSYRTVDKGYADLANGEATSISPMSHGHFNTYIGIKDERATTTEEFTTLVTGQKMVYELATPQTISLTPTEVMMLENNNTIWADSGRVQLTYLSKAAQRVQTMNASLQANALKLSGIKITKRTPTM